MRWVRFICRARWRFAHLALGGGRLVSLPASVLEEEDVLIDMFDGHRTMTPSRLCSASDAEYA